MAIPSRQIGWSTTDNLLWQISKQVETLGCVVACGTSGRGAAGTSGTSGYDGDKYRTTSTSEFTLGVSTTLTVGTGLAYTVAQDIIIAHDLSNHQTCMVTSYDPVTGVMVIGPPFTVTGGGTYSSWIVNLDGAAGGDGSSGTSGSSGSSGINGTSGTSGSSGRSGTSGSSGTAGTSGSSGTSGANGTAGTSGSSGTSGANGIAGTSGISGVAGTSGVSGTSGTSPVFPLPVVYGLYSQTANSTPVTNTTVETTIINGGVGTLTVGANQFSIGDAFRGDFGGVISTGNNQTIRFRIKAGSVILVDSGAQTINNVSNNVWSLSVNFTVRTLGGPGVASIVTLGTFNYAKTVNGTVEGFSFNAVNNTTFDTTISNTLDVTVQWGAASVNNTIYSDLFTLNKIY